MIGQVKTINGVKTVVPLSNEVATDSVASGNMESVTSNAVAKALQGSVFNSDGTPGNYFLLAKANVSTASVPYIQGDLYLSYHDGVQYSVGTLSLDIVFNSIQTTLNVKGWTDIALYNSNTRSPSLIVTRDGDEQYFYLQCTDSYFGGWAKIQKYNTFRVVVYDEPQSVDSLQGTVVYDSRTDLTSSIHTRENNSYVLGETETGALYIDGKPIYRRVDNWTQNNIPVGTSSYTFSSSHWSDMDTVIDIKIIRPKTASLLSAIVSAGYIYNPSTKTLNIYGNQTDWTGPFLLIFEYTKP